MNEPTTNDSGMEDQGIGDHDPPLTMSVEDLAHHLRMTTEEVWRLNLPPSIHIGNHERWRRDAIAAWLMEKEESEQRQRDKHLSLDLTNLEAIFREVKVEVTVDTVVKLGCATYHDEAMRMLMHLYDQGKVSIPDIKNIVFHYRANDGD